MPDGLRYSDEGDVVLENEDQTAAPAAAAVEHGDNLAVSLPEETTNRIGVKLTEELSYDQTSRTEWDRLATRYMQALGIGPESDPDDHQYEFSDTSDHPLLLKSLTSFQAKALSALMPKPNRVADTKPAIDLDHIEDPAMRREARRQLSSAQRRVRDFYNWYLLKALPAYEEDMDQIINDCGLQGAGFRRIAVDRSYANTPVRPIYVPLENLILSYDVKNFRSGGRITHKYAVSTADLVRGMQTGLYRDVEVTPAFDTDTSGVTQERDRTAGVTKPIVSRGDHIVYDIFTYLFLEDDPHPMSLARPYVITVHQSTQEVLSIRRNWVEDDPDETPIEHFAAYIYSPGRNAMSAVGLGALLTNITMALRKAQRRALDAAYLANHPSGFIVGGMSIRDDSTPFTPGELRTVDVANGDIQRSILLNPFRGPDAGLIQLYDRMHDAGKELGNIASIDFASMMKSGVAAGPALAAYDESTEFQTSVHRRLYRGHALELGLIHDRMREVYGGQELRYGNGRILMPDDLLVVDLVPAMKPGHVSRQRELMEAQAAYELSAANPQEMNKREALARYLEALGAQNIEDLMLPDPAQEEIPATDPVNEYLRLMRNEPLRVAPQQNHRAHIEAHAAQLKGLQNTELPLDAGAMASAALAAHIAEHEAMDIMVQVAASLQMPLDMLMEGIPPEMEAELAPQIAQIVVQLERARNEKTDQDPRIAVELIRAESRQAIEQMRAHQSEIQRAAQLEIRRLQEEGATYRNITDNLYAIEIAQLRESGREPTKPDIPSPPTSQADTPMPRFDMSPRR